MKKFFTLSEDMIKNISSKMKGTLIILILTVTSGMYTYAQPASDTMGLCDDIFGYNLGGYHIVYVGLTPSDYDTNATIDALFYLAADTVLEYGDFSIGVRFTGGTIDARNATTYQADTSISYVFGQLYHCWIETAVYDETYNVYIQTEGMDSPAKLATDYGYRLTGISELDVWGTAHNSQSDPSPLEISNLSIVNAVGIIPIIDSTDAALSALSISNGQLSPVFSSLTTDYTVTCDYGTTSVVVTATPNTDGATVTGDGTIDVSSGSGTATITVTALDGTTTKEYTIDITVNQTPSDNANLASLSVDAGSLVPAFDPETTEYNVAVPEGTTTVNISAETADTNATVSGTGGVDVSGGSGTGYVIVTAEDGSTKKTYTVNIVVGGSAITQISESEIQLVPNPSNGLFHVTLKGTFEYKVYNLSGMMIINGTANDNCTLGDELDQGTYILEVSRDNQLGTYKLIKL